MSGVIINMKMGTTQFESDSDSRNLKIQLNS